MRKVHYSKRVINSYTYTTNYWQLDLELEYSGSGVQVSALDLTRLQELNLEGWDVRAETLKINTQILHG
jgi:hypothetical protein